MGEILKEGMEYLPFSGEIDFDVRMFQTETGSQERADYVWGQILEDISEKGEESLEKRYRFTLEEIFAEVYGRDEREFSFEDLQIDWGRLDGLAGKYAPASWGKLDLDARRQIIAEFEGCLAAELGLKRKPEIEYYHGPQNECGAYDGKKNVIRLNAEILYDGVELLDTVAHETWHCYQFERARNLKTRKDALYAVNFSNYIQPELVDGHYVNFEDYEGQLVEAEARAFANQFTERLGERDGIYPRLLK